MTNIGLSVVMPAKDESGNLRGAVDSVIWAAVEADLGALQIIVVDDGSTDDTHAVAQDIAARYHPLTVIQHAVNCGLRAAYETGLDHARYEYATWVPADNEMARESLRDIFAAIGTADLIVPYHGTPERRPWFRRLLTWVSTNELNLLLGHNLPYFQGTTVYSTALARRLPRTVPGFFFCAEMLSHALEEGLSYALVPLEHRERQYGVSKAVSWRAILRGQMAVLTIARDVLTKRWVHRAEQTMYTREARP